MFLAILTLGLCASPMGANPERPGFTADPEWREFYRAPSGPFPARGTLEEISAWLSNEYSRRARNEHTQRHWEAHRRRVAEGTPAPQGACGGAIAVFVRPDVLSREQWAALAARCRDAIDRGTPVEQVAALRLAGYHLQQAAFSDRTLTEAFPPALIGAVTRALGSAEPEVRRAAAHTAHGAEQLGVDPSPVVPPLLKNLRDADVEVRRAAANGLRSLCIGPSGPGAALGSHDQATVVALVRALDDPDRRVRFTACSALGHCGEAGRAAVPALIAKTHAIDPGLSRSAMRALQHLGPHAVGAVPTLIDALRDPHEEIRGGAALALGGIGPEARAAVPDLIALLDDASEFNPTWAARALSEIGPDASGALPRLMVELARNPEAFGGYGRVAVERLMGNPLDPPLSGGGR